MYFNKAYDELWITDKLGGLMNFIDTKLRGVKIVEPVAYGDNRGWFMETYNEGEFHKNNLYYNFVQDNQSFSAQKGVLRGLHFQKPPYAQNKLVRVILGSVLDVVVDIRRGSPTFGKHVSVELSGENHRQIFIPRGFAHGFVVLSPEVVFQYKCDNFYSPQSEGALAWDDPELGIDWKIPAEKIILSEKDKHHPRLKDAEWLFDYKENLY